MQYLHSSRTTFSWNKSIQMSGLLAIFILSVWLAVAFLPEAVDWHTAFRPAARAYLSFQSPYTVRYYVSPPWVGILMIPFALFSERVGRGLAFIAAILTLAYTLKRLGGRPVDLFFFLISPPVMHMLLNGNLEWLSLAGILLPPQIGLFLVLIKPQVGIGVALFWLIASYRKGGPRETLRIFTPVMVVSLLFMIPFGFWPARFLFSLSYAADFNASFWPVSIPAGLALMVYAVRKNSIKAALAAGPCLSPYVLLHSWSGALLASVPSTVVIAAASIFTWILALLHL